jgi:hypothetical protein
MFRRTCDRNLPSATESDPSSIRSQLILFSHPLLTLQNILFLSGFCITILSTFHIFSMQATFLTHLIPINLVIIIMTCEEKQIMELFIIQFSPSSCSFISLKSKYSLLHPVLQHFQSKILIQNERPSFISILYNR